MSPEQVNREFKFVIDLMPQMVWATQPDGYHDFYNQRWYEYTGLTYEETKNKGWSLVLHPDDYERTWKVWQNSLDHGMTYEIEYRMKKFDGTYRWFLARAEPLRDDSGNIIKWFGTCTEIQEQREMLQELERTKEELHHVNANLKESNEELTRINRELDGFVYTASHDLKAPLNNLEGLVALLEPSQGMRAEQEEILMMISNSVKRYKEVITDMSFIAQSAKDKTGTSKVNFSVLLDEIKTDIGDLINSTDATIIQQLEVNNISYSRKDLRSILFNLISNAIKYREPNRSPRITVHTSLASGGILLEVEDNGSGIKKDLIPQLFDKYYRINTAVGGTGLGLFIVKRLLENAHGKIKVESEEGKGSKFSIFLKDQNCWTTV